MITFISRRELLKRAGLLTAAAAVPVDSGSLNAQTTRPSAPSTVRPPLEQLSASEFDTLDAVVARLIPSEPNGLGAREAGAALYIDRALGGALASSRAAYTSGLAALDRYARSKTGRPFAELQADAQDGVLVDTERDVATGFDGPSSAFFALVRSHTIQGTFCDPFYGGNAGFAGWDLIGYPGVRTSVDADEQRLGIVVPPNHKSAYEGAVFNRATADNSPHDRSHHGD